MNWNKRFLNLAKEVSTWSKDPSTKVGAVIVRPDKTIASLGYNGFAKGVDDSEERLQDRETKYAMTLHAELNAILSSKESLVGYTIYVYPFPPCTHCASAIIQSGITKVVYGEVELPERWVENVNLANKLFKEVNICVEVV